MNLTVRRCKMALVINYVTKVFDTSFVKKGYLLFAKHKTWSEGKGGFVTAVTANEITVQYHPGIGNITNHFFLPVEEVAAGDWEVRWSENLTKIHQYEKEGDNNDSGGIDL